MEPQNQLLYQHFQQTIGEMKQRQSTLVKDIDTVKEQLASMELELVNLKTSIVSHQGGMSTIELLTTNNIALVQNLSDQPLSISQYPVTQQLAQAAGVPPVQQQAPPPPAPVAAPPPQVAPSQQQYAQQPTQQAVPPQPAITPQAQQAFAPPSYPSPGDISAAQAIQGPQIVQGSPPSATE